MYNYYQVLDMGVNCWGQGSGVGGLQEAPPGSFFINNMQTHTLYILEVTAHGIQVVLILYMSLSRYREWKCSTGAVCRTGITTQQNSAVEALSTPDH